MTFTHFRVSTCGDTFLQLLDTSNAAGFHDFLWLLKTFSPGALAPVLCRSHIHVEPVAANVLEDAIRWVQNALCGAHLTVLTTPELMGANHKLITCGS